MDYSFPIVLNPADASPAELSRLSNALETVEGEGLTKVLRGLVDGLRAGKSFTMIAAEVSLTPAQAAQILGVSRSYVSRMIRSGRLAAYKVGAHHRIPMYSVLDKLDREASLVEISTLGMHSQSPLE